MEMKFSDELNAVFSFSREEAMRTGNYGIEPDHLVLGLLRHANNDAFRAMVDCGVDTVQLKQLIDSRISTNREIPFSQLENISLSRSAQNIVSLTLLEARRDECTECAPVHLLLAIVRVEAGYGAAYLRDNWQLDYGRLQKFIGDNYPHKGSGAQREDCSRMRESPDDNGAMPSEEPVSLQSFGYFLTEEAAKGNLDPVHGRDAEIERVIQILGRRRKNNPMLVGDAGVGKSAIVEGIAIRIANNQVPESIAGKKIFSLDLASVVAGTKFRGEFEKRLKAILNFIAGRDDIILFIDEFHTIVGAGKSEGGLDAANIIKPSLARGEIQCIGATTVEEFTRFVEKDGALDRRFQKVVVNHTDADETLAILHLLAPRYEEHHKVNFPVEALDACVRLSDRYVSARCQPDKAIDLMDEAGSMVRLKRGCGAVVGVDDIALVVSKITGIPVGKVARSEGERLMNMAAALKKEVVGQDEAIDKLCRAICRSRAGIRNPKRPIGSFLLMGPTGVGKTLLAKKLAEYLFDREDSLVRIDMSEYMEKFSVSRLLGAPPGYVGFDDNGQLTEAVRHNPYCVVLLDEMEKAHPDVFNLLLQVMDEGRLTDSHGRSVSFLNAIIIMTSNVGSTQVAMRGGGVGFEKMQVSQFNDSIIRNELSRTFPPEFLGRLDDTILFNNLSRGDISTIVDIEIEKIRSRVREAGFKLCVSHDTRERLVSEGYNPKYGARPLRKAMLSLVEDPVSEKLIKLRLKKDNSSDTIKV